MSSDQRTRGSVLIPSTVKVPLGKLHNWQSPPNLCLNVNKELKAQRCQISYKIILVALIFLLNTHCSQARVCRPRHPRLVRRLRSVFTAKDGFR